MFSLVSGQLVRIFPKKYVLAFGLCIYMIGGIGAYWAPTILSLVVFHALLSAGAGLIGPLAIEILSAAAAGIFFSKFTHKFGIYAFPVGFAFFLLGFFALNFSITFPNLVACVISIGLGIGTIYPILYYRTFQICLLENTTSAFTFIDSGFSLGQFVSPFFYFGVSSLFIFQFK
ncbi:MAG: hypothetical protein Q7J07_03905 [Pelolinea sp.]|nr:hypothetical protein [Pelolinea sp.]